MEIKLNGQVSGLPITQKFLELANLQIKQAEKVFQGVAEEVGERVIDRTPVDTGRARGNWQTNLNDVPQEALIRYDKSGGQAKKELKAKIKDAKLGDTINLTNQVNYTPHLEFGSSKQAPSGMVRVTIGEAEGILQEVLNKVKSDA